MVRKPTALTTNSSRTGMVLGRGRFRRHVAIPAGCLLWPFDLATNSNLPPRSPQPARKQEQKRHVMSRPGTWEPTLQCTHSAGRQINAEHHTNTHCSSPQSLQMQHLPQMGNAAKQPTGFSAAMDQYTSVRFCRAVVCMVGNASERRVHTHTPSPTGGRYQHMRGRVQIHRGVQASSGGAGRPLYGGG